MKKLTILFFVLLIAVKTFAQDDDFYSSGEKSENVDFKGKKLENWSFGGNFWFAFRSYTYIEASPLVLYKANPRLRVGTGFRYIYYNDNILETNIYGPRATTMLTIIDNLHEKININIGSVILAAEYEFLSTNKLNQFGEITPEKEWSNNLYLGFGLFETIGSRGGVAVVFLYNILENRFVYNPSSNPTLRFSFFF